MSLSDDRHILAKFKLYGTFTCPRNVIPFDISMTECLLCRKHEVLLSNVEVQSYSYFHNHDFFQQTKINKWCLNSVRTGMFLLSLKVQTVYRIVCIKVDFGRN